MADLMFSHCLRQVMQTIGDILSVEEDQVKPHHDDQIHIIRRYLCYHVKSKHLEQKNQQTNKRSNSKQQL